mmetsp:Transcript_43814/g.81802  ORF Transcript_43814/g.81802 Transcript_43814/m.81802 type:complete len:306 (+) Transcript_43814:1062-1979(+)
MLIYQHFTVLAMHTGDLTTAQPVHTHTVSTPTSVDDHVRRCRTMASCITQLQGSCNRHMVRAIFLVLLSRVVRPACVVLQRQLQVFLSTGSSETKTIQPTQLHEFLLCRPRPLACLLVLLLIARPCPSLQIVPCTIVRGLLASCKLLAKEFAILARVALVSRKISPIWTIALETKAILLHGLHELVGPITPWEQGVALCQLPASAGGPQHCLDLAPRFLNRCLCQSVIQVAQDQHSVRGRFEDPERLLLRQIARRGATVEKTACTVELACCGVQATVSPQHVCKSVVVGPHLPQHRGNSIRADLA